MSDLTRCPHGDCKAVVYIDDRFCNSCGRDMNKPRNKPAESSGNE